MNDSALFQEYEIVIGVPDYFFRIHRNRAAGQLCHAGEIQKPQYHGFGLAAFVKEPFHHFIGIFRKGIGGFLQYGREKLQKLVHDLNRGFQIMGNAVTELIHFPVGRF